MEFCTEVRISSSVMCRRQLLSGLLVDGLVFFSAVTSSFGIMPPRLFVMCLVGYSPDTTDCGGWKSISYADHIARKSGSLLLVYRSVKHLLYIDNHMAFT